MLDILELFGINFFEYYAESDYIVVAGWSLAMDVVITILGFIISILIVGWILPVLFIRPSYKLLSSSDRGLKKYSFDEGRAVVYEPAAESKRYVDQYIVSVNNGEKFLKCKVDPRVYSIEYDVIAFNAQDKALDVLTVTDLIVGKRELSSAVALPLETAYVSLLVKYVNGVRVTKTPTMYYSGVRLAWYVALSAATTVAHVVFVKPYIADFLTAFSKNVDVISDFETVIITTLISAACSTVVILMHCRKDIKIKNDSKILALIKKIIQKVRGIRHGKGSTKNFKGILSIFAGR